jgi:hypothetical protein
MEKRRRRNLDHVHALRVGKLLERVRPVKQQIFSDCRAIQTRVQLVEMLAPRCQVVREQVGQRHHLRRRIPRERRRHAASAPAAAQQRHPYSRIRLVAENPRRLEK